MRISAIRKPVRHVRPGHAVSTSPFRSRPMAGTMPEMIRALGRVFSRDLERVTADPAAPLIDLDLLATKDAWFYDHFVKVPRIIADFLARAINLESAVVLDFGCGEGLMAKGLARYAHSVHGVDIAPAFPDVEQRFRRMFGELSPFPPVTLQVAQAGTRLPYGDGTFDAVYAWSVFEHVGDVPFVLGEIHRVLRPGGVFFLQIYPLFYSAHGGHLWNILDEPWIHLRVGRAELIDRIDRASLGVGPDRARHDASQGRTAEDYRASVISCQDSLNRITVGELTDQLRAAGFAFLHHQTTQDSANEVPSDLLALIRREDLVTDQVVLLMSR